VLGLEFVTGAGDTVRSGGRVVKNVAGFDLTRLLVGSWGTLGVITEVTVRLRARPEITRTFAIALADGAPDGLPPRLRALPFTPLASELVNDSLGRKLGSSAGAHLLVQLGGNDRSIRAQQDLLAAFGAPVETDDGVWSTLRRCVDGVASWRWSQLPSAFGETWRAAERVALSVPGTMIHGNPARGVVRIVVPHGQAIAPSGIGAATKFEGTVVHETLPADAWSAVDLFPASDAVSRGIRQKFDPAGILNPGILGVGE
jgi:glycolate oxidase FAD binding subunit